MDREQVLATLRAHEPALKAAGVVRLSLFGSTARGDRRQDSDIDLLAASGLAAYPFWAWQASRFSSPRGSGNRSISSKKGL
jgi:hypothetical protein